MQRPLPLRAKLSWAFRRAIGLRPVLAAPRPNSSLHRVLSNIRTPRQLPVRRILRPRAHWLLDYAKAPAPPESWTRPGPAARHHPSIQLNPAPSSNQLRSLAHPGIAR